MHIRKVVSIRASSIGDCLLAKYLLENIHVAYPEARCAIVVGSRGAMIRDLLQAYPWIDVLEVNRRSPRALLDLITRFHGSDLVVTPYTGGTLNISTKLVARVLAKRERLVGFEDASRINKYLFDVELSTHGRDGVPRLHERAVLEALTIPVAMEFMSFSFISQPNLLERFDLTKGEYIIAGLFSGADARGLSPQKKQELIDALTETFPSKRLVFLGTLKERLTLSELLLPENVVIADTTLQEASELIHNAYGMVSLGTGTSHIASLLHTPLAVLVSCQGRQWVGKEQFGNAPIRIFCKREACPSEGHDYSTFAPCINALDMKEVAQSARELFSAGESSA